MTDDPSSIGNSLNKSKSILHWGCLLPRVCSEDRDILIQIVEDSDSTQFSTQTILD